MADFALHIIIYDGKPNNKGFFYGVYGLHIEDYFDRDTNKNDKVDKGRDIENPFP